MNLRAACLVVVTALAASGCATANNVLQIQHNSPEHFVGTRANVAAIRHDRDTLRYFADYSMHPARYPLLDLPFSLALDTTAYLAPEFLWYAAGNPTRGDD